MGTVLEYLEKYGEYTFRERPMNEVDSLALCQLAYLKFDGMVPDVYENSSSVTLKSLVDHVDFEKLFADTRFEKQNRALLQAMLKGKRYSNLKLNCYINIVEEEWETQFSAITYLLDDGTVYIAYRGTDETIVGWKEDFNMAYLSPVPGQDYSVKYLNMVTRRFRRPFYVGGHSKGGNLAIYSAMNCAPDIQDRIIKVYCMDGPGFRPEVLERCNYNMIAGRVVKILPHSSLVGIIFESDMRFQVVESKRLGLMQHDLYTWKVKDDRLVRANDIYEKRKRLGNNLNQWILSLDEVQLRTFVDTLFHVIEASQANTLIDFTAEWKRSMNGVVSAMKELDKETVKVLKTVIKSLFDIAGENMKKEVSIKKNATLRFFARRKERKKSRSKPLDP